jgi:hypothetical protein
MPKDASALYQPSVSYGELERLSALETLKGLKNPEKVTLADLVSFLDGRGLWRQFAKITLGDLRTTFAAAPEPEAPTARKRKKRILEEELEDAYAEKEKADQESRPKETDEGGGMDTEEFARQVMPFVEGNGEVTLDDIEEYCRLDRKVVRHHLAALVKEGRIERIGVGRHAVYSSL